MAKSKSALGNVKGFKGRGPEIFMFDPQEIHVADGWNHRIDFETDKEKIMNQIRYNGVKAPLNVKKTDGVVILVDGERRLRATLDLIKEGHVIEAVPVRVAPKNSNDIDLFVDSLIANDSKALDENEEAVGFTRLINMGLSVSDISERTGRTEVLIRKRLKLAAASPDVKKALKKKEISVTTAENIVDKSAGSIKRQNKALKREKKSPTLTRAQRPLTFFIKGKVRHQRGRKGLTCEPVKALFDNAAFLKAIELAGFDPASFRVSVTPLPVKEDKK